MTDRPPRKRTIWIGWDRRERDAYNVCCMSLLRRLSTAIPVHPVMINDLVARGLYDRPTEYRDGRIYDHRSRSPDYDGAMATEFAISRFLVPKLAREGLALFMDCDMLVRCDLTEVFDLVENQLNSPAPEWPALWCVKHPLYRPAQDVKMDNQAQTAYARKNWSSFMVFDCEHPRNKVSLTVADINERPGRDLHAFYWLRNHEIAELPATYNHLVGEAVHDPTAKVVHFTNGLPNVPGYEGSPFSDEWRAECERLPQCQTPSPVS